MEVKIAHQISTRLKLFRVEYKQAIDGKDYIGSSIVIAPYSESAKNKVIAYLKAEHPSIDARKYALKVLPDYAII